MVARVIRHPVTVANLEDCVDALDGIETLFWRRWLLVAYLPAAGIWTFWYQTALVAHPVVLDGLYG
jgi:hypothetical protein